MPRTSMVIASVFCLALAAHAQNQPRPPAPSSNAAPQSAAPPPQATAVDGIAARIGNDVVTDSEVRQLEDYQKLLEGRAQERAKVLEELVDQWIVRTEAAAAKFPRPTADDVTMEFQALLKQFPSREEFESRLARAGLTQDEVRQVLERQLYYVRFLNYKFHAATQVTAAQIEAYYQKDLAPQLQRSGQSVPPVSQVEAQIRQLLTQEEINEKAAQWLDEAKARLHIVIQSPGGGG